jgi:linoleate 10R-lipoxygenase
LEINEYHSYTDPALTPPPKSNSVQAKDLFPTLNEDKLLKQDDDIFNRARLINCAFFMNVILGKNVSWIVIKTWLISLP